MNRCETCICFDPAHYWCVGWGSTKEPKHEACEYYIRDEGDDEGRE